MLKIWNNRHFRTLLLAVLATVTFVSGAIFSFDVDPQELLSFFLMSLAMVGSMMVVAGLVVMLIKLLRRRD